jgi:hypothetical protein
MTEYVDENGKPTEWQGVSYLDENGSRWTLKLINLVETNNEWAMYMIWRPEK